jgi:hypothetical protein
MKKFIIKHDSIAKLPFIPGKAACSTHIVPVVLLPFCNNA